jgi:hypothetical protein
MGLWHEVNMMIYQSPYWYDIVPSSGARRGEIAGKWLYFDKTEKLHQLLGDLNAIAESGRIRAAKVARKLPEVDPFPEKECVLCIFTSSDKEEKETVKKLLKDELGISVSVWKSDEQTIRDWEEGGWLRVQADISKIRRDIEAGRVEDVQSAQSRVLELTRKLEEMMKSINDPDRKAELDFNKVHEVHRRIAADLTTETEKPEILSRLKGLEEAVAAVLSKLKSGEIGFEMQPKSYSPNLIFVIMPFSDGHIDTYDAIERAADGANLALEVKRVDELPGAIAITDEIHRLIQNARIVICDLTDERPNVYYELGFARGLNKPLICIAREGTKVHFDVYGLKTIFFKTYRELREKLKSEIEKMCG